MLSLSIFDSKPLIHAYTSTQDGNLDSRFSYPDQVKLNLTKVCQQLSIDPGSIIQMDQVHSTNIKIVDSSHQGKVIKDTDALITTDPHLTLMVRIADCAPIIIYDQDHHALGLVHSGWRGTIGKIAPLTIEQMMINFDSHPQDLLVAIGPCLTSLTTDHPPLQQDLPEWQPFITKANSHYTIKLLDFLVNSLINSGIVPDHLMTSQIDTNTNSDYYSYLRSKLNGDPEGRFAALVSLQS